MSLTDKLDRLETCVASLRHAVRHNGAAISAKADIMEIAEHVLDCDPERVATLWKDIGTIDAVKKYLKTPKIIRVDSVPVLLHARPMKFPEMTTEELLEYGVNDERLTAEEYSWAVIKVTKSGAEILTYGGNFFQAYKAVTTTTEKVDEATGETTTVESTEIVQDGDAELLKLVLEAVDAAWLAEFFEAEVQGNPIYTESWVEYFQIPCQLPGDLSQLISISIERTKLEDGSEAAPLQYSLTDKSCDNSNPGMVELPHGMWLIYDNSTLESAPQALLIPKDLAEGKNTGLRFESVKIAYSALTSGLAQLRLLGDSFGEEYIISTQNDLTGGTWRE